MATYNKNAKWYRKWWVWLLIVLGLAGGTVAVIPAWRQAVIDFFNSILDWFKKKTMNEEQKSSLPRSLRNNNPGNIKINPANDWKGRVPLGMNTDGVFEQFQSLEMGARAMIKTLRTYYDKHKLTTIASIVNRWAPPSENNTGGYIAFVSDTENFDFPSSKEIPRERLPELAYHMAIMEAGGDFGLITKELFERAARIA